MKCPKTNQTLTLSGPTTTIEVEPKFLSMLSERNVEILLIKAIGLIRKLDTDDKEDTQNTIKRTNK